MANENGNDSIVMGVDVGGGSGIMLCGCIIQ